MDWFQRLNEYFPVEEMKAKEQIEALLKDKSDHYYKDESDLHIMMYAEYAEFIFIDFLWVSEKARGKGIGKKLIQQLKDKRKTIILEVEPVDENNVDTEKRLRFYFREGFKVSGNISYQFQALVSHSEIDLDIMYWDEQEKTDEQLLDYMITIYEEIHSYKQKAIYGYAPKLTSDVVKLKA
ncbi:GNAT family N-acetyltransferase [Oceanobacillus jeddahense]|uniref:GNAT family N-acetyltransferase n=1 Tax=Oceanobacillus jeddahense TaxID=1462527 RepID=A0ABY5K035_9BACI|nr:GNAT family N-acetyltransferase [Oceanobacillus jeddahense]UUI04661.1 GNAT family N-acetyltransferase [Oceanobacillus jeddahense]